MSKPFVFHGKDSCIVRCFHVHYVGYSTESEREKERKKERKKRLNMRVEDAIMKCVRVSE